VRTVRVPVASLSPGELELDRETSRYVARVLRLAAGDAFVAFDPEARIEADATVGPSTKDRVRARVGATRAASVVARRSVTLVQCIGKGDKLDAVVRDATELGATAVLPATSERTVAARSSDKVTSRLRRIAVEAARQCGRGDVPEIGEPQPLSEILRTVRADRRVALAPGGDARFRDLVAGSESLCLVVGPEGGLSEEELRDAVLNGFVVASLGPFVLRTETVAAAALGAALVLGD
jgi:16S rRNA (uracil1498-N3)-methyltransferase